MAEEEQTFVGLVALRVVFGGMGLFVAVFGVVAALTAESDGTAGDVAGTVALAAISIVAGLAGLAVALERLVIDGMGVHRRNPLWRDRSTPWSDVVSVRTDTDQYNTHPVIETARGRTVRLRAASSLIDSSRSTAHRATDAIRSHLGAGD